MATFRKRSGSWEVRVSWYDDEGTRKYTSKGGFKTKSEARLYALDLEQSKADNALTNNYPTFKEYFKEWFETYKQNKISNSTQRRYKIIYKLIKEYFKNKKLNKITRFQYQKFINEYGSNHAPESVKKTHSIIKSCINSAVIDKLIKDNFTKNITLKWDESKKISVEYLNINEIKRLIKLTREHLDHRYTSYYMILTAIYTGMRLQEIAGLTWKDVNFNWKTININKSWNYVDMKLSKTKTDSSNRIIKANDILLNALKELKKNNTSFVFENAKGSIPTSSGVNKVLRVLLHELGIDKNNYHFHSLRHSHVALLLYYGVELYPISKRLGHSNMSMTAKKYAYLIDELKQKSDNQITNLLDNLDNKKMVSDNSI